MRVIGCIVKISISRRLAMIGINAAGSGKNPGGLPPRDYFCSKQLTNRSGIMFNYEVLERQIRQSGWWEKACRMPDRHENSRSGVMLHEHLEAVEQNVQSVFRQPPVGFYGRLFALIHELELDPAQLEKELRIVALLHDVGKTEEDKTLVIPHPLTGKPAHKRHGLVGLMAAMEILGDALSGQPECRDRIYRTVELHDISYGLFREYRAARVVPGFERWAYINDKIHTRAAAGLLYLLLFKLADTHGHADVHDVSWFFSNARQHYFEPLGLQLPLPEPDDIR